MRRVLRDDGTLWLNLGDSYASGKGTCNNPGGNTSSFNVHLKAANVHPLDRGNKSTLAKIGLKPKDLVGIPWRVAFALQADGWYLRSDIIWHKPNPMPESVTDRPSKAHEYMFLLSKSAKYYYDHDAIREKSTYDPNRLRGGREQNPIRAATLEYKDYHSGRTQRMAGPVADPYTRNRRTVWTVATKPYKEAHFATFPPELIDPCILAGAPAGGLVMDPFMGSGTVAQVAKQHDRHYIGCELHQEYIVLIDKRMAHITGKVFDKGGNEVARRVKLFD